MDSKITTDLEVDEPLVQDADYRFSDDDRGYIDNQVRGVQQHLVDALIRGRHATFARLSGASASVLPGDIVCLASLAVTEITVTRLTAQALTDAVGPMGIVIYAAAPGSWVLVAFGGVLPKEITGLAVSLNGYVRANTTTGRCERVATLSGGDVGLGTVDLGGFMQFNVAFGPTGATGSQGPPGADGAAGADGADGTIWYSGSGAPSGGLGVDGDFYLDTASYEMYGPKTSGSWGSGTSLVGPAGAGSPAGNSGEFQYNNSSAFAGAAGLTYNGGTSRPTMPNGLEFYDSGNTMVLDGTPTASRTITFQDATHTVVGRDTTDTLTNKTIVASDNTITDTGSAAGDILVHNGTKFVRLAKGTDDQVLKIVTGSVAWAADAGGGGGTPGGSTGQFQWNNAGAFAGSSGLTYNSTDSRATAVNGIEYPGGTGKVVLSGATGLDATRTQELPNASGVVVLEANPTSLTNKTINVTDNTLTATGGAAGDLLVHNGTKFVPLAIGSEGEVLKVIASAVQWGTEAGGGGDPGGSNLQFQWNNNGVFAGAAGLTYNTVTARPVATSGLEIPGSGGFKTIFLSGSTLSADRNIDFPNASGRIVLETSTQTLTNKTFNTTDNSLTATSGAAGDLLVHNGTKFVRLAKGTDNQVLQIVSGSVAWGTSGGGAPGGSVNEIQYNNGAGGFSGATSVWAGASYIGIGGASSATIGNFRVADGFTLYGRAASTNWKLIEWTGTSFYLGDGTTASAPTYVRSNSRFGAVVGGSERLRVDPTYTEIRPNGTDAVGIFNASYIQLLGGATMNLYCLSGDTRSGKPIVGYTSTNSPYGAHGDATINLSGAANPYTVVNTTYMNDIIEFTNLGAAHGVTFPTPTAGYGYTKVIKNSGAYTLTVNGSASVPENSARLVAFRSTGAFVVA